jgi:uncharacterized C2H2 Zn-finger protein
MNLYSCPRCSSCFSTEADDIAMHLMKVHNWSCKQAEGWLMVEVEKEYKK